MADIAEITNLEEYEGILKNYKEGNVVPPLSKRLSADFYGGRIEYYIILLI